MKIEIGKYGFVDAGKLTVLIGNNTVLNSEKIFASSRSFFLANQENWQAGEASVIYPDFSRTYGQSNHDELSYLVDDSQSYDDLTDLLDKIVCGKYSKRQYGGFVIDSFWSKNLMSVDSMYRLHRQLFDLWYILTYKANRNDYLVMCEPEQYLDCHNQAIMARLIARLVNLGINIIMMTHSDYIMKELSTLIMLNQDDGRISDIAKREGYGERELLSYKDVKVYTLTLSGIDINSVDDKQGIIVPLFDDFICKMNRIRMEQNTMES